jgi:hypothetical protein
VTEVPFPLFGRAQRWLAPAVLGVTLVLAGILRLATRRPGAGAPGTRGTPSGREA